jgi:two-component system invasion response regulator UvrY
LDIVLAYNHTLIAEGITSILSREPDMHIVSRVQSPAALMHAAHKKLDLLITDYAVPGSNTLQDLQYFSKQMPSTNMLIISTEDDKDSILHAVRLGIKGFLASNCSREELLLAVRATARGEKFFAGKILNIILEDKEPQTSEDHATILTLRETEVLKFLAQGNSTQNIADKLYLSPHTVQTHRKSIIRKLNIKSPTQFVIYALDMGLIKHK